MTEHENESHNASDRPAEAPFFEVLREAAEAAFHEQGFVLVPIDPTVDMLRALDDEGDRIWDGTTEHWFRNEEEAFWYARKVWKAMVNAAKLPGHGG
ncbi:MAG: hypothetical protein FJX40_01820 [Alphaproteobacteria bacterium]|nr:hypothetical protein [Alphaproteobacteria bacterium]MBM3641363.1 hypothetical protein [Alphaproteobacteria bacterium]